MMGGKGIVFGHFKSIHQGHLDICAFATEFVLDVSVGVFIDELVDLDARKVSFLQRRRNAESLGLPVVVVDRPTPEFLSQNSSYAWVFRGEEFIGSQVVELESSILTARGGRVVFNPGELKYQASHYGHLGESDFRKVAQGLITEGRMSGSLEYYLRRLELISEQRVLILGDVIVDEYCDTRPLGMSQEDPSIAVEPLNTSEYLGGAGIIANHFKVFGASTLFASCIGTDEHVPFIETSLECNETPFHLVMQEGRRNCVKKRYRALGKTLLRVNTGSREAISDHSKKVFLELIDEFNPSLVYLADFGYSFFDKRFASGLVRKSRNNGALVVADSQTSSTIGSLEWFSGADVVAPTEIELRYAVKARSGSLSFLLNSAAQYFTRADIAVTLGAKGVVYRGRLPALESGYFPSITEYPKDTAGAGDLFLTTVSLCRGVGFNFEEAVMLGSIASGIHCETVGNTPINKEKLIQKLANVLGVNDGL